MEPTPGPHYQIPEPEQWQTGDLYKFPTGLVLCIGANHTFAYFITAEGMPLAEVQTVDGLKNAHFMYNTGLTYQYKSRTQVQCDFAAGLFTPYFEIL